MNQLGRLLPVLVLPALLWSQPLVPQTQASPPLHDFGTSLLHNFRGLFSSENLVPALIGAGATGAAALADDETRDYFAGKRRMKELGNTGGWAGQSAVMGGGAGVLLLWSYHTSNQRFRAMSYDLAQGFVVNFTITGALKYSTHRLRPDGSNNVSFVSGHTSGAFTTAAVVSHYYPKYTIPAYAFAGLVGVSRMEKNRHWLSDVVGGAALGYIVGSTVVRRTDLFHPGPVSWSPYVLPRGVGIAASIRLP